jgi:hypothetical protein
MTKNTKKPAAPKTRTMKLARGVGFDAATREDGSWLLHNPAVAIASHPIRGLRLYGPFVTAEDARRWIDCEGDCELIGDYGSAHDVTWLVECLDVPTHFCG